MMALIGHIVTVLVAAILVTSPEAKTLNRRAATSDPNPNVRQLFTDIGGQQKVDLVVAMDRSKSISEEVFYLKIKKLARAILTQYATLDTDYVRLAVISFAINATTHFDYISNPDSAKTKCELFNDPESKWHDILYSMGEAETNIKAAFEKSLDIFQAGKGHRPDAKQVILLMTDGKYTDSNDPIEVSRQLKEGRDVTIYGAGVGVWLEIGNVRALTTLTAGSDLYSHFDDWKNYVTGGDELTSYGKDPCESSPCLFNPNPIVCKLFTDIGGRQKVDLVVAMDRSESISEEVFYLKIKKLARAILTQYATLDTDYVRLAVISFAVNATTHFDYISNLDSAKTKCELFNDPESKWHDILYSTGEAETNIKAAFQKSLDIFQAGKGHRQDAKQIILLITDGKYTDNNDPIEVSRQLKEGRGVTIYGAGVGVWLEIGNVRALTTLTAGSDLYSHYDDWKNYVTGGYHLTSYGKDLGQTWSRSNYAETCTGSCMDNAQCYCDIDRGVDECLCQAGYAWINDRCTECPANTYKAGPGNQAECSPCPPGTTSSAGARSSSECVCGGANCPDPCESSLCGVNQLCVATTASDYECQCVAGWTGAACDVNEDACLTATCGTGSVCVDGVGPGMYVCVCTDWTYTGIHCTVNEDECEPGLCKNNAMCADRDNNFQCVCEDDFVGRYCQTTSPSVTNAPDPCESSPCGVNQLCVAINASDYECECVAGWTGAACDVNEDACPTAKCSGGSLCVDGVGPILSILVFKIFTCQIFL